MGRFFGTDVVVGFRAMQVLRRGAELHYPIVEPAEPHEEEIGQVVLIEPPGLSRALLREAGCATGWFEQRGNRACSYRAATTRISTRNFGCASLDSTQARAGVLPAATHLSHTEFISS